MVKTLAFHLITAQNAWSSLYRAALLAGAFWLFASHPGWVWLMVFVAASFAVYRSRGPERRETRFAYWGAVAAASVIVFTGESSPIMLAGVGIALALTTWAKVSYPIAITLVAASFSGFGLFAGAALISAEAMPTGRQAYRKEPVLERIALALMAGLIALEVGWFARALPFFNAAGAILVALTLTVMRDFLLRAGKSTTIAVLRAVTVFLLCLVALFMSAAW